MRPRGAAIFILKIEGDVFWGSMGGGGVVCSFLFLFLFLFFFEWAIHTNFFVNKRLDYSTSEGKITRQSISFVVNIFSSKYATRSHFLKYFIKCLFHTNMREPEDTFWQWWIQDLPERVQTLWGGANLIFDQFISENCMKMKKFWSRGVPCAP